jgi:MYND finger
MATQRLKFIFQVVTPEYEFKGITKYIDCPIEIIAPKDGTSSSTHYQETFRTLVKETKFMYGREIENESLRKCVCCRIPATRLFDKTLSCLHLEEPCIVCFTMPVCANPMCELGVDRDMSEGFDQVTEETGEKWCVQVLPCGYCGKINKKISRCARCKRVAYCNQDCQKADWKRHRRICITE